MHAKCSYKKLYLFFFNGTISKHNKVLVFSFTGSVVPGIADSVLHDNVRWISKICNILLDCHVTLCRWHYFVLFINEVIIKLI